MLAAIVMGYCGFVDEIKRNILHSVATQCCVIN